MSEEKWLPAYSGQTTDQLMSLRGQYRTDSILAAFEAALDRKADRLGDWRKLSPEERVVLMVEALEREVNNGGYSQFFLNASHFVPGILSALHQVGCAEVARLKEQAINIRGAEVGSSEAIDSDAATGLDGDAKEALNNCDASYYRVAADLAGPKLPVVIQAWGGPKIPEQVTSLSRRGWPFIPLLGE